MSRDDTCFYDIFESARVVLEYMHGKTWSEEFSKDSMLQDAVVRRLEIIGEASGRVSNETLKKYFRLPWQAMKGTRNKISREYDFIELDIIWDIIEQDLPHWVAELEKIVPNDTNA